MALKFSPQAVADIRVAVAWWTANRPAAPALLREELREAFRVLADHPRMGAMALESSAQGIRRLFLRGTRYFVYYSVHNGDVEVLRIWHASRGTGPAL